MSQLPLEKAIDIAGGQTALARLIGESQSKVGNWLRRSSGVVPGEYCRKIEFAVGGEVTRYDLRPDVFGPPPNSTQGDDPASHSAPDAGQPVAETSASGGPDAVPAGGLTKAAA